MEIPAELNIVNRLAARDAAEQTNPGELGREAFLELLVAQLSNQDPLEPVADHQFVSQLATFSSLEQLEQVNEGIQAQILMNQSVNNALATNLIGKEVLAEGSGVRLGAEGDVHFEVDLQSEADVTILIRDASGQTVRRLTQSGLGAGRSPIDWDGRNEAGERVPAGDYTLETLATHPEDGAVPASTFVRERVTGVSFFDGSGYLMLGDLRVPLASVVEVLGASE